jgi:hypothetical protein
MTYDNSKLRTYKTFHNLQIFFVQLERTNSKDTWHEILWQHGNSDLSFLQKQVNRFAGDSEKIAESDLSVELWNYWTDRGRVKSLKYTKDPMFPRKQVCFIRLGCSETAATGHCAERAFWRMDWGDIFVDKRFWRPCYHNSP